MHRLRGSAGTRERHGTTYAVTLIRRSEALALENVAKVTAARVAHDFDALHAK